jgi:hypothetical protein
VSEQRKRLERALRGCAERGVPADTVDLWPAIRERVSGERISGTRVSEEQVGEARGAGTPRRRAWPPRLVPKTPLGWALAVLSVLILSTGLYAASGPIGELIGEGLPGSGAPGPGETTNREEADEFAGGSGVTYRLFRGAVPGGGGEEIGQTQTADGARVTLKWAYADEEFVVVGIEARDLDGAQKVDNYGPVVLQPALIGEEDAPRRLPPRVDLTDASGEGFTMVGGGTQYPGAVAVFEAPESLKAGPEHRFRLEVPLYESDRVGMSGEKPDAGPFVFEFEVPVRPVPVVWVSHLIKLEGFTLRLERVVNSPGRPQAIVCVNPLVELDDELAEYTWTPWLEGEGIPVDGATGPRRLRDGCWSLTMGEPVEGPSSVTVAGLAGTLKNPSNTREARAAPKIIRGPWTFEFEAPEP